ncbi:hypothetical protein H5410_040683 [Solanum commersonii]|uniref:Uncharacterized protein n=1 Tax=Solanum commersonii TaxID=4109 RepID=A0A9J5XPN2_SOLCO|nr:hypothetical protein H5410_040683 [Solanum commersonii]
MSTPFWESIQSKGKESMSLEKSLLHSRLGREAISTGKWSWFLDVSHSNQKKTGAQDREGCTLLLHHQAVYRRNGNLFFRTTVQKATTSEQKQVDMVKSKLQKLSS